MTVKKIVKKKKVVNLTDYSLDKLSEVQPKLAKTLKILVKAARKGKWKSKKTKKHLRKLKKEFKRKK